MKITKEQARLFLLYYQNLLYPHSLSGKEGIIKYIKKVGSIQFDPLRIIDINSNLVLQARIKNYKEELLHQLLYIDRELIDDWDKNMCIYHINDWPYFKRYREKGFRTFAKEDLSQHEVLDNIRKEILEKGPLSSQDLNYDTKVDWFWFDTRLSKAALECMYFWGELIIHHKVGIRKYYDFSYKHIPNEIYTMDDPNKTINDFHKWIINRRIGSVGLLWNRPSDAYLGIYFLKSKDRDIAIKELVNSNELIEVYIEDINYPFYIRNSEKHILHEIINGIYYKKKVSFIAPLDNLLWDRKLVKELFDFTYTWEVYKPAEERKYGYYVLPVLYGDKFIARFEPRLNKKTKYLEIINWWWEENIIPSNEIIEEIKISLTDFSNYLNSRDIIWLCALEE